MYKIDEKSLKKLLREQSSSMVGRFYKQVEVLQQRTDLDEKKKLDILKSLLRERIYESFRDIENSIKIYNHGHKVYRKMKIYKESTPTTE